MYVVRASYNCQHNEFGRDAYHAASSSIEAPHPYRNIVTRKEALYLSQRILIPGDERHAITLLFSPQSYSLTPATQGHRYLSGGIRWERDPDNATENAIALRLFAKNIFIVDQPAG
jgi:hypothetical protein